MEHLKAVRLRILAEAGAPLVLVETALEPVPPAAAHLAAWWNRTMAVAPPVATPPFAGGPRGAGGQKPAQ